MCNPIGQNMAQPPIFKFELPLLAEKTLSDTGQNEIFNLSETLQEIFLHLNAMLKKIGDEQKGRTLTMADLVVAQKMLDSIKNDNDSPYASALFDMSITLDDGSPAAGMNLWSLLVYYGIREEGSSPPASAQELDDLIDVVKTKNMGISSFSQATLLKINQITGNRDNNISLLAQLIMQEIKLMRSVLSTH